MSWRAEEVGQSAFGWALWKVLDGLTARVLTPTPEGGLTPAGQVDPAALLAAVRELSDTSSPVVLALARVLGTEHASEQARGLELDAAIAGLTRAQGLVVSAVALYAARGGGVEGEQG
jgi:hypothetical protein